MVSLFTTKVPYKEGTNIDSNLRYYRERMLGELNSIINYYHDRNAKVKNNHMLVRLLTTVSPNYNNDIFDYIGTLDSNAIYVSKNFNIVSNINAGEVMDSIIFGDNSKEVFVYSENELDLMELDNTWKDLEPLKLIVSEIDDTSFILPSNDYDFLYETLNVFLLDVRMLAIQYKYWALERIKNDFDTDPATFIYRYVLPNSMRSILDIAIMNKLVNTVKDDEYITSRFKHPFNTLDLDKILKRILNNTIKYIDKENKQFSNILGNIYLVNESDAYSFILKNMPKYETKQALWVTSLILIKYIDILFTLSNKKTLANNKHTLNELRIYFKIMKRSRTLDDKLPIMTYITQYQRIDDINTILEEN